MSSSKLILLRSSDGETFEVDENVAMLSLTIKHMIDDDCADSVIPLPNVSSQVLSKVIEYCKKHMETPTPKADDKGKEVVGEEDSKTKTDDKVLEEQLKAFDKEFVDVDDMSTLFDYILAANYLNIKSLLDLTCQTAADMIKYKSPEEVRKLFNIKNDFTPEEEAEVRKENDWAFE